MAKRLTMLLFPVLLTQIVFAAMYSVHEQSIREHRAKQSSKFSLRWTNDVTNVIDIRLALAKCLEMCAGSQYEHDLSMLCLSPLFNSDYFWS